MNFKSSSGISVISKVINILDVFEYL